MYWTCVRCVHYATADILSGKHSEVFSASAALDKTLQKNTHCSRIFPPPPFIQFGLGLFGTLPLFFFPQHILFFLSSFLSLTFFSLLLMSSFFSSLRWRSSYTTPPSLSLSLFLRSLTHLFPCISTSVSFSLLSFHPSHYLPLTFFCLVLCIFPPLHFVICLRALSSFWFYFHPSAWHLQVSGSRIEDVVNTFITFFVPKFKF